MTSTTFGRYDLVELLGRGGMGEVWRAFDTRTDREVAIKVLPAHFGSDPEFEARFRREAHAAAGLKSPHILPIHDFGEIDGRLFVDMRLIDGHDLAASLTDGPLEPQRAVRIVEHIAWALHTAHRAGLVHRDVKPSNILVDEDDFAYLIDFGIARAATDTRLTGTGAALGTWAYMAPERFRGEDMGPSVDVYSLACVLCECLTGATPYPTKNIEQIAAAHLFGQPPRPSAIRADVAAEFDDVVAKGMAKDPAERYSTTRELADAARSALSGAPTRPGPVPPSQGPPVIAPPEPRPRANYPAQPTQMAQPPTQAAPLPPVPPPVLPIPERPGTERPLVERRPPDSAVPVEEPDPAGPPARRRRGLLVAAIVAVVALAGTALFVGLGGGDNESPVPVDTTSVAPSTSAKSSEPAASSPPPAVTTSALPTTTPPPPPAPPPPVPTAVSTLTPTQAVPVTPEPTQAVEPPPAPVERTTTRRGPTSIKEPGPLVCGYIDVTKCPGYDGSRLTPGQTDRGW